MSTLKVGAIRGVSASEDAITVANDGTATGNFTNRKGRNLIINGQFSVAQRATTSTVSGINTVDRWSHDHSGTDEAPTFERAAVTTGGAYDSGFRTCLKTTNGNQTSGAGTGDFIFFRQRIEAQNVATSGWNYVSASSDITVSFWAKSSVAQTFQVELNSVDGTRRIFAFEFTISSTDTWTKITKTIPGNSGLQFDNDNGNGLELVIFLFLGTDSTSSGGSLEAWGNYSDRNTIRKDMASTWYTTNDATFELTGVQLEVGSKATDFEHEPYCDTVRKCLRYYYASRRDGTLNVGSNNYASGYFGFGLNGNIIGGGARFPEPMRSIPTMTLIEPQDATVGNAHLFRGVTGSNGGIDVSGTGVNFVDVGVFGYLYITFTTATQGGGYLYHIIADAEF